MHPFTSTKTTTSSPLNCSPYSAPKFNITAMNTPSHSSSMSSGSWANILGSLSPVQKLFSEPDFTDIELRLSTLPQRGDMKMPVIFSLHKNIIAGSPYLREVMETHMREYGILRRIEVFTGPAFHKANAFAMALQVLYGCPLIDMRSIRQVTLKGLGINHEENNFLMFNANLAVADFALCYAAAGAFLDNPEITDRGIQLALQLFSWDTVELILSFGLGPENFMITCANTIRSMKRIDDFKNKQAVLVLRAAIDFITANTPSDFTFFPRAQANFIPSRIPPPLHSLHESCCKDPRLEDIQFGSLPSFAAQRPTRADILVLSALLLTLPFKPFTIIIENLKAANKLSMDLMKSIVLAREARRENALRLAIHHRFWNCGPGPLNAMYELGYTEFVTKENIKAGNDKYAVVGSGYSVRRSWTGFDWPSGHLVKPWLQRLN